MFKFLKKLINIKNNVDSSSWPWEVKNYVVSCDANPDSGKFIRAVERVIKDSAGVTAEDPQYVSSVNGNQGDVVIKATDLEAWQDLNIKDYIDLLAISNISNSILIKYDKKNQPFIFGDDITSYNILDFGADDQKLTVSESMIMQGLAVADKYANGEPYIKTIDTELNTLQVVNNNVLMFPDPTLSQPVKEQFLLNMAVSVWADTNESKKETTIKCELYSNPNNNGIPLKENKIATRNIDHRIIFAAGAIRKDVQGEGCQFLERISNKDSHNLAKNGLIVALKSTANTPITYKKIEIKFNLK